MKRPKLRNLIIEHHTAEDGNQNRNEKKNQQRRNELLSAVGEVELVEQMRQIIN